MKKIIPVAFVVVAAALAFLLLSRSLFVKDNSISRAKVIVPLIDGKENESSEKNGDYEDDMAQVSFIQLANGETLIGTSEFDVDGDNYDDQVNIIKTAASPFITLIVGLYDNTNGNYQRSYYITTNISQVKTFVCTGLDVLGKHRKSLVYQGITDDGKISMVILHGRRTRKDFEMDILGSFEADGTIFIQQNQRNESYELSRTKGEAYPVWVYTSENASDSSKLDQLQTMYVWSEAENKYVVDHTVRVAGNRVAAKELAKIQDGTVATFAKFLDGLWYKTDNSGTEIRHLFFDYANSEIIFEFEGSEEVYSWLNSNLRRNGIYFSAVNKSIENLQRRFDISLVSVDEIRIKLQDDVRMLISESTLWDGNYKKFVSKETPKTTGTAEEECIARLCEQVDWITSDETVLSFNGSAYSAKSKLGQSGGRFTNMSIEGIGLIQFRSENEDAYLAGSYVPSFYTSKKMEKDARGRMREVTVVDKDTVILQKASINPEGFYKDQTVPLVLKKYIPPKEDEVPPQEDIQAVVQSENVDNPVAPKLKIVVSPQYFSPDGDGDHDELYVALSAECEAPMKSWSFIVKDPQSGRDFWVVSGKETLTEKLVWNGKSKNGELVQSATDYPYEFKVTDEKGLSNSIKGFVQVDVLVIRDGERVKLQVPSIIFRSDAADFKSDAELQANPDWDGATRGLDQHTIENNLRVLSRISEILKKFREYNITIEGNANNLSGSDAEEEEVRLLSEQRAKFVRDWLIKDGVSASHLSAHGNGSKNPVTRSTKIEEKWKNRRVEFILKK